MVLSREGGGGGSGSSIRRREVWRWESRRKHGTRHGACQAQGDGRTKQDAPGFGGGKLGGQIETPNFPPNRRPTKCPAHHHRHPPNSGNEITHLQYGLCVPRSGGCPRDLGDHVRRCPPASGLQQPLAFQRPWQILPRGEARVAGHAHARALTLSNGHGPTRTKSRGTKEKERAHSVHTRCQAADRED